MKAVAIYRQDETVSLWGCVVRTMTPDPKYLANLASRWVVRMRVKNEEKNGN